MATGRPALCHSGSMASAGQLTSTSSLDLVEEFATAEQQCCAGIGWEVIDGPVVTLQITANEAALDVLETMLRTTNIEDSQ